MSKAMMERLRKNTTLKFTSQLSESVLFNELDMIQTQTPMINVALAGELAGGFVPGVTFLAGPSRHFKTGFAMCFVQAFFRKYPQGTVIFYDSEFGAPKGYFEAFNLPTDQILHTPITNIEELNHDIMNQLKNIDRDEQVLILIDSVGNLASIKEIDDALNDNQKADFTRPKRLKSLFRMITPHLKLKNIPLIAINHTYSTMELYSRQVMGGGTGPMFAADTVWILGRQQDAEKVDGKKELNGYKFVINVEKSRFVREKSKIIIEVSFEDGISPWSGLLDAAEESGHVMKTKIKNATAWQVMDPSTGALIGVPTKEADTYTAAFWTPVLSDKTFHAWIENRYKLSPQERAEVKEEELEDVDA